MKEKTLIIGNTDLAFETEKIAYQLSALLDVETNEYSYVSLSFIQNYGMLDEKYVEIWDNEDYLIDTLYLNVLCPWNLSKLIPSPEEFTALLKLEGVQLEDFEGIYELFTAAINLGMFKK